MNRYLARSLQNCLLLRAAHCLLLRAAHCLLLSAALALCACASEEQLSRADSDPWESLNRGLYKVNDVFDRALLRPIAYGYRKILPSFVRRGVSNFSDNLLTPRSSVNNFLQGKPRQGFSDLTRFLFNSTIGIGGLIDVASAGGLDIYNEDFGQTLAVWGVPDGPYTYLPLFGPRTLRDALALPIDLRSDLLFHYDNTSVRDRLYVLRIIDIRARTFTVDALLKDSKDRYVSIRESYLQNRRFKIYDGNPPEDEDFYDDFFDEEVDESDTGND